MHGKLLSVVSLGAALAATVVLGTSAGAQSPSAVHFGMAAAHANGVAPNAKTCYSNMANDSGNGFYATKTKNPATYTSAGAVDVVLAKPCKVKTIEVNGVLIPGGAVNGVTVYVYADNDGLPGKLVHKAKTTGNFAVADFNLTVKKPFKIQAGTFWVSVQAKGEQSTNGWYWETSTTVQNNNDVWENPGGGWGHCPTWATLESCFGDDYDYMLQIN